MELFGIPLTGEHGVIGILISIITFVVYQVINGGLVTGKRQDQEQKRHEGELEDANERARAWQEAWQESQNLSLQQTETISRLAQLTEVFEKFINSLPREAQDEAD